jgi:outer membrane protein assembly factor BamB
MRNFYRLVGLAAALCALPARGDDWSGLGRDDARSRAASEVLVSPAPLGVPVATGSESVASPVAADGYLVTAGLDGVVRAFRESDRSLVWSRQLAGAIFATPLVDRGRIYLPSSNGAMSVLRLADGGTLWTSSTGSADQSSPVISGGRLFLGRGFPYPSVTALDPTSAAGLWSQGLEQVTSSSPAIAGTLLILGCNSGKVYALDTASGAIVWTLMTGAPADFASPLVVGNDVYVAAGATLERVALDPLQWGLNWSATCVDPAPPSGAQGVNITASSPVKVGNSFVSLVRFVYVFDLDGDGNADQRILREFAYGVGALSHAVDWQVLLAEVTVPDVNGVPPYAVCPTPAVMGTTAVVASSVNATLRLLDGADGSESAAFALDAPCLASPIVANARITALTRSGTLYAFEGTTPQPGAATGLAPDASSFTATPSTLSWNSAGAGATYRVRISSDGEFLMNYDYEFVTASTSIPCPTLPTGHVYTWGVRVQNSALAYGPWSSASFKQNVPPAPPGSLSAVAKHGKVLLSWMPSPSPSAVGYRLAYGPTGGALGAPVDLGNVTSTTVSGLTNGTSYTFELRAVDALPDVSTPVTVDATPVSAIHIGGTAYDTLGAALGSALPGQIVQLGADTFPISATLSLPAGVELRGVNAQVTRITASGPILMIDAGDGSSISLLSLSDGAVGVRASGSGVVVRNCVVRNMAQNGIEVYGTADVINDTLVRNGGAGLRAWGLAQARNNIVQENAVGLAGVVVSRYNDVSDGYSVAIAGPGDLQSPVSFLDPSNGDFREAAQQPSLDAGDPADDFSLEPPLNGGRINQGAFGNTSLAATSLVAAQGTAGSTSPKSSGGGCGLLGLEALAILALARRRR